MIQLELAASPRRRPTKLRVFARLPSGGRVALYERRGLGEILELGQAILGLLGARPDPPRVPPGNKVLPARKQKVARPATPRARRARVTILDADYRVIH